MSQQNTRIQINVPEWITITDADVAPGTEYWSLIKVHYTDKNNPHKKDNRDYNRGRHQIYAQEPHDPAVKMVVSNGQEEWKVALDKPTNEPAGDYAMFAHNRYSAWMDGMPSDRIEGMHMPAKQHVSYLLWWEKTTKVGTSNTPASPAPPTPPTAA